ncbi:MAG: hypothetical protein IPM32_18495 [Ignavibacteriae bacterium]|nr:hypothetical protein [Ignavibacteriota bacterium]
MFEIDFQDIYFVDENHGWAVGERWGEDFGRGMIVHTSDGGINWEIQYDTMSTERFNMIFFKSIRMKNTQEGWALGGDYFDNFSPTFIYKTVDGGKVWNKSSSIDRVGCNLEIANIDTLWIDGYGIGPLSTSTDGGLTWMTYKNEYKYIGKISPISGAIGWAFFNDINNQNRSALLYTYDRGKHGKKI